MPWFEKAILLLVLCSVGLFFAEMQLGGENSLAGPAYFLWSERAIASILTLEVLLRFLFCSSMTERGTNRTYFRSPEMVFDVIAVLPFWLGFFVAPEYLAAVRSMRILRLLKFYRASPMAHLVMENLIRQWKAIRLVTGFVTIVVLFSGTVMHHLEAVAQPEAFGSLWSSIWWAVVTMTTVGYGDMSPVTHAGQAVTMVLMLTSIGIVGALISIVGNGFEVEGE
jgi:voltage-gated potassium channel